MYYKSRFKLRRWRRRSSRRRPLYARVSRGGFRLS